MDRAAPQGRRLRTATPTGAPAGFLLWDVWGKVDAARELIRAAEPVGGDALQELLA